MYVVICRLSLSNILYYLYNSLNTTRVLNIHMLNLQRFTLVTIALLSAIALYALPTRAFGATVELVSSGEAVDITDTVHLQSPGSDVNIFAFSGVEDVTYELVFTSDTAPTMIITPGADMENANDWEYNAEAGTVTMNVTYKGIVTDTQDENSERDMFIIALVFSSSDMSAGGAPVEMIGSALATNLLQWLIIPPQPDAPYFGFQLTGTPGTTGFFHMFIPATAIEYISTMSGEELTVESLAVFVDDQQASMNITEVDGGAYIDINITFAEDALGVSATDSITKTITTGAREIVSLAAKKDTLDKGATAKLFGWIHQSKAGKEVVLYRKLKGEDKFTLWKTVETNDQGYYKVNYTAKKTGKYKAKYKGTTTDKVQVTVE